MSNSIPAPSATAASLRVAVGVAALLLVTGCGFAGSDADGARFRGDGAKAQSNDATAQKEGPAPAGDEPNSGHGDPTPVTTALPASADDGPVRPDGPGAADQPNETTGDKPAPDQPTPDEPAPDEPANDPTKTSFARAVLSILMVKCAECHHAGSPHTNFASYPFRAGDMKAYVAALLVDAKPEAARMPPKPREPLTAAEFGMLTRWAADGLRP